MAFVEFKNLQTWFYTDDGIVKAVNGVSFEIPEGKDRLCRGRIRLRQKRDGPFHDALGAVAARAKLSAERF